MAMELPIDRDQPPDDPSAATIRVLVVDDDPLVLESLLEWLCGYPGVDVRGFASAEQAMTSSHKSAYDVCLLDYRLDGVNGVVLGAMIHALNPEARLILMSGVLDPKIERHALDNGFHSVIPKPFPPRDLSDLVFAAAV